jgi:hypothetical protein
MGQLLSTPFACPNGRAFPKDILLIIARLAVRYDSSLAMPVWLASKCLHNDVYITSVAKKVNMYGRIKKDLFEYNFIPNWYMLNIVDVRFALRNNQKATWSFHGHLKSIKNILGKIYLRFEDFENIYNLDHFPIIQGSNGIRTMNMTISDKNSDRFMTAKHNRSHDTYSITSVKWDVTKLPKGFTAEKTLRITLEGEVVNA